MTRTTAETQASACQLPARLRLLRIESPSARGITLPFFRGLEYLVPNSPHAPFRARVAHHREDARARRGRHPRNLGHANGAPPRHPTQYPDRKSTRLNSSHLGISYAVFCLK